MELSGNVRFRLGAMMFLQYAFNGVWIIPLVTYLNTRGYSGDNIGNAYGTFALAGIVAPFFVGMIADRFFAAQRILGVLNILAGVLLFLAAQHSVAADGRPFTDAEGRTVLGPFYWLLLGHMLCYVPTWALTNTIALRQMTDPAQQFPGIRVMGTIGWIVVSMTTLFSDWVPALRNFEGTATPMHIGAGIGILSGLVAFALPHTEPAGKGGKLSFRDILGVKALALFKDRNFAVFAASSFVIFFPAMFYWQWANAYLNESGMKYAAAWQSSGQMAETVFLFVMPWFFARFGVKKMLLLGLFAWLARFVCFSQGHWQGATWLLVFLGLLLHGPCYDFFFVTGQLYTNKKASQDIQAQAQGLISFITFGMGWFFGSKLAGLLVDRYRLEGQAGHHWEAIYLWPAGMVAAIAVLFALGFRDDTSVSREPEEALREKEGSGTVLEGEAQRA